MPIVERLATAAKALADHQEDAKRKVDAAQRELDRAHLMWDFYAELQRGLDDETTLQELERSLDARHYDLELRQVLIELGGWEPLRRGGADNGQIRRHLMEQRKYPLPIHGITTFLRWPSADDAAMFPLSLRFYWHRAEQDLPQCEPDLAEDQLLAEARRIIGIPTPEEAATKKAATKPAKGVGQAKKSQPKKTVNGKPRPVGAVTVPTTGAEPGKESEDAKPENSAA